MEDFYMLAKTRLFRLFLSLTIGIMCISSHASMATDSVTLYTPNTKITVPPGESINYAVDVFNNSSEIKNVDLSLTGVPKGWICTLKSGSLTIEQLSILPHEKKSLSLTVEVPLKVNKGTYRIKLVAAGYATLNISVIISEQGTFKTEFTTQQPNMQGYSKSLFTFNTNLRNMTADKQLYALMADAPRGWTVTFKANYQPVTSVDIEPNNAQNIVVEMKPPEEVETGTYKIPIKAVTNTTSADLDLEAVVLGTYNLTLTTPVGLVSAKMIAGEEKKVELIVSNTGSSVLSDIKLNDTKPANWEVSFDPKTVVSLLPGKNTSVFAIIKANKKAIPGDYVINLEAGTPEVISKVAMRVSVETPMLWGWIGVFVIIASLGIVYYLFRKYGRR
jgi:uncharacterized membrane protein